MTLDEFINHCIDLDIRLKEDSDKVYPQYANEESGRLFDCGHVELSENKFYYEFDGHMGCKLIIENGEIWDCQDVCPEDPITDDHRRIFPSIEAWKLQVIEDLSPRNTQ